MKVSYKIVTYLVIIISLIHIGITPIIFDEFTMRVGWFIGVGLMGIFLGFLNISYWRSAGNDSLIKWLCLSANINAANSFVGIHPFRTKKWNLRLWRTKTLLLIL